MTDMVKRVCRIVFVLSFVIVLSASYGEAPKATPGTSALDTLNGLEMVDAKAEVVNYRGRPAVHLLPLPNHPKDYSMLAMVSGNCSEYFYLRPPNGRSGDQLRRNHSVQYVSTPDYPWERLRKETPGVYESYADLDPGAWTRMKVVVSGKRAKLYVNGADQPG